MRQLRCDLEITFKVLDAQWCYISQSRATGISQENTS